MSHPERPQEDNKLSPTTTYGLRQSIVFVLCMSLVIQKCCAPPNFIGHKQTRITSLLPQAHWNCYSLRTNVELQAWLRSSLEIPFRQCFGITHPPFTIHGICHLPENVTSPVTFCACRHKKFSEAYRVHTIVKYFGCQEAASRPQSLLLWNLREEWQQLVRQTIASDSNQTFIQSTRLCHDALTTKKIPERNLGWPSQGTHWHLCKSTLTQMTKIYNNKSAPMHITMSHLQGLLGLRRLHGRCNFEKENSKWATKLPDWNPLKPSPSAKLVLPCE